MAQYISLKFILFLLYCCSNNNLYCYSKFCFLAEVSKIRPHFLPAYQNKENVRLTILGKGFAVKLAVC